VRVRLHDGAAAFTAAADPFFRSDPFSANVVAVVAARIAASAQTGRDDRLWATVVDGEETVRGVAMHTPPHRLFVSRMPPDAAAALAETVADADRDLPGVNGACESTAAFAKAWAARTGQTSTVITAMRMYRLGQLRRPPSVPGEAVVATAPDDVELVAEWVAAFHDEAVPDGPVEDWFTFAQRLIATEQVHLWRDEGRTVSLAGVSAPAAGVARVAPVYTPPAERRHGYGTAVTAEATAAAIAAGAEHVVLYTDLANPTSNAIYQTIGYRPDHDADERRFD
jgi:predicted GNAT family acetyltransferase